MPSMGSSGGNGGARNRQRNFSVGSNVSSSAHKENRENLSNVADHLPPPANWNMLSRTRYPEQESGRRYLRQEYQNRNLEACEPEQDTKWHCESLLAQLEQVNLHTEPLLSRVEPQSRLQYQADSLRDAQQRLGRLQHAMNKNSTGLQHNVSQNRKPKIGMTVGVGGRSPYNQSGNFTFDSLSNRSFNEQSSPSVREMYVQREHLLASSNDGSEQDPEYPESHTTLQNGIFLEQTTANTQVQNLQDRVERLERELQRTNFVCEILVREQRNLTSLLDNLAAPTMTSSTESTNSRPHSNGADANSSFTQQQMLLSLNQCCQMLMQLQRDFASMSCCVLSNQQQQRQTTSAAPPSPAVVAPAGPNFEFPARERRNTGSDSNRQDPLPTLNNQVPPGTRTNNYWDNFRSYSRQNLLSTGPSKAAAEADDADGSSIATPPGSGGGHDVENGTRTKRKVNKGQRQVEIGVHSPHADNRALAYGLRSATQPDVTIRNLNPRIGNDASAAGTALDVKIAKDTSGLMCSGARPKENRRTLSEPLDSEESDTSARAAAAKPQNPSVEQALQETLQQHAGNPRFLAELSQLLKKFDSDPVRSATLSLLHNVAEEEPQNPLVAAFTAAAAQQHEFFTPQLLELFLSSIQQDSDDEGATALPLKNLALPLEVIGHIRHLLEPFLCEPLAQVQQHVVELLSKISFQGQPKEASTPTAPNDLAEADQVCDSEAAAAQNWNDNGRETQAAGLDEVPIRLLSGGGGGGGQTSWFAEDEFHDN